MKKQYFLIFLSAAFTCFGAEKNNCCQKHKDEIARLRQDHAREIDLYEQKLKDLMVTKDILAKKLSDESNSKFHNNQQPIQRIPSTKEVKGKTFNEQRVYEIPSIWKVQDNNSKK